MIQDIGMIAVASAAVFVVFARAAFEWRRRKAQVISARELRVWRALTLALGVIAIAGVSCFVIGMLLSSR